MFGFVRLLHCFISLRARYICVGAIGFGMRIVGSLVGFVGSFFRSFGLWISHASRDG